MRRSQAVSSEVVEGRHQARLRAQHLARLRSAAPVVGSAPLPQDAPPRYAHLDPATKAVPRETRVRSRVIAHANGLLVDSMCRILARRPQPNHDPELLAKARKATVEDAYRPGPIPLPKSLNKEARTRQLEQIVLENERFLARLIASPGVYRREGWERAHKDELKYLDLHCKFPYVDPKESMPALNPMLAIANAQSDRAAEIVLRNQQALQHAHLQHMQQQQQHTLPQLYPAQQHQGGTASLGSTSSSLPPYLSALPPMHASNAPNHFPPPPAGTAGIDQSPPSTAAGMRPLQPLPPHSARTASPPKVRAQYTAQGVRIIRTGRGHSHSGSVSARPAHPTLDPLRSASRKPKGKFQPLRSQQLPVTQNHPSHSEEHKEEASSHRTSRGAASSASSSAASSSAAASAPAGPGGVMPLFEDALVISGRSVLVRVGEVSPASAFAAESSSSIAAASSSSSSPSPASGRLDICVFDPYTSLEYSLSLPFTFIRMCFYQVPDLLEPHNRRFLVQTLLHYLVFAQAAQQSGAPEDGADAALPGLELLVDIVPPLPRSNAEAAAWARVQEEAALEQQAWELEIEKEAARARREQQQQQQQQLQRQTSGSQSAEAVEKEVEATTAPTAAEREPAAASDVSPASSSAQPAATSSTTPPAADAPAEAESTSN